MSIGATEPKQSAWDKLKGVFTKKPAEATQKKVNPKEFAQQMLDKTNAILDSNKPQPTLSESAQDAIKKINTLKRAVQTFLKQFDADAGMIKVKLKTLDPVQSELKKAKNRLPVLEKQLKEMLEKGKPIDPKVQNELNVLFKTEDRLEKQLGRLRADLLQALIDVPKSAKPILKAIQDIVALANKDTAKNTVEPLIKICDELLKKGDAIVDQLLLKHEAYGKKSDSIPEQKDVMIDTYVKSIIDLSNKIQPLAQSFELAINKLNSIMKGANILALGSLTAVKAFTGTLVKTTKSFSLVAELAKDIASVTVSKATQEVANAQAEIKKSEKELAKVAN
jgi:hypothetical protein